MNLTKFPQAVRLAVILVASSSSVTSAAPSDSNSCPLAKITGARELQSVLSKQAVEIIKLAAGSPADNERLSTIVSPSASFSTGGGDVVVPLGVGVEGARALAKNMEADTFRYLGWDYLDMPADACSLHVVTVEFVDGRSNTVSTVEFSFDRGLLVKAKGWSRSFEIGSMNTANRRHR